MNSEPRILVVDDDPEMLGGKIWLESNSGNGSEALEISRNNPDLDLILMDIKMPGLNGYDATRKIREYNQNVIIFTQSVFGLTGDREKAMMSGCNEYLTKPINKDQLFDLINGYLRNSRIGLSK